MAGGRESAASRCGAVNWAGIVLERLLVE
jgi:hypothetical protein